jgi:flagellar motor switch protein FliM
LTNNLRKAWSAVEPLDIRIIRVEFDPAQAAVAVATDLVIASSFELRIDEQPAGRLHLAIPFATVEPVRKALGDLGSAAEEHRDPLLRARMAQTVRETPVELVCELGSTHTTLRHFLTLGVGDVLRLNTGVDSALSCTIEGQPRLFGHPVVSSGNVALEITALAAAVEEK